MAYIMKCENISKFIIENENLTNIRFELNEMLATYYEVSDKLDQVSAD